MFCGKWAFNSNRLNETDYLQKAAAADYISDLILNSERNFELNVELNFKLNFEPGGCCRHPRL